MIKTIANYAEEKSFFFITNLLTDVNRMLHNRKLAGELPDDLGKLADLRELLVSPTFLFLTQCNLPHLGGYRKIV